MLTVASTAVSAGVAGTAVHTATRYDDERFFLQLRRAEYSRLDTSSHAYLDFTGSALYAESQIRCHADALRTGLFGNPHSESEPSIRSTDAIERARAAVLHFVGGRDEEHVVVFTANTTAAIKLVAESFPFGPDQPLVLAADNHNSMNGVREYARRAGAPVQYVPLDDELRLDDPLRYLTNQNRRSGGLFGFPAQSNFSGVKHALSLVADARMRGWSVLLDAAAYLPTNPFRLADIPADFVVMSLYKICGYPTGVGVLVARRDSLVRFVRPWFAGGTVEYASVQHGTHLLRERGLGAAAFEDGTPSFLSIGAVEAGLDGLGNIGMERINNRVTALTSYMVERLRELQHDDGTSLVEIHGPSNGRERGATVAFNVRKRDGRYVPYSSVELRARSAGVALRGGCFCNPGAAEAAFGFPGEATARCLKIAAEEGFSIPRLSECLGPDIPVGAVRASLGIPSSYGDIDRAIDVVGSYRDDP
ncbi:MAG TPA: aminotransferase class V-fold PLP-dependent enzyme [Gemmatimonadaceae bacterium]|nr:aminotransferase class V-fold PLP-dependent enzyme [Gemmatimonadaceae bacterium]